MTPLTTTVEDADAVVSGTQIPFNATQQWETLSAKLADLIHAGRNLDGDLDRYLVTNIQAPTTADAVWEAMRRARLDGLFS